MTLALPEEFILLDTEYTAWEGSMERKWNGPNEFREIVQIGALHVRRLEEAGAFSAYIKPVKNPQLSDYFIVLTGITQEKVDSEGKTLDAALRAFKDFVGDREVYSYGSDMQHMKANCDLLGIDFPLDAAKAHNINPMLGEVLTKHHIDAAQYSSGTLIKAFGKEGFPAHDAVNDMRNLLEVLKIVA